MTNLANRMLPETLRTLASGSISGTYAALGTPLVNPARIMYFNNTTDVTITFSFDGSHDHFVLLTNTSLMLEITNERTSTGGAIYVAEGTQIYVKGSPGSGSVFLSVFYGTNGN